MMYSILISFIFSYVAVLASLLIRLPNKLNSLPWTPVTPMNNAEIKQRITSNILYFRIGIKYIIAKIIAELWNIAANNTVDRNLIN